MLTNKNILLFIICFPLFVIAQKEETYFSEHYPNGKLKYEWYQKNNDTIKFWKGYMYLEKDTITYQKQFNVHGNKTNEGWLKNNIKDKYWIYYHKNTIQKKGNYTNGSKNGTWYYYTNSFLDSVGDYKNDIKLGTWTYYAQNSKVVKNTYYTLNPPYYSYSFLNKNTIIEEGYFDDESHKIGVWKTYYSFSKQLQNIGSYSNNIKNGYWKFYHPNGNLHKQGAYTNGTKNGYWYTYNSDEELIEKGHYINNYKEGWWCFYKDGVETSKCQYKNNIKNGYCITYTNGKLTQGSYYIDGKKTKEWDDYASFRKDNANIDLLKK